MFNPSCACVRRLTHTLDNAQVAAMVTWDAKVTSVRSQERLDVWVPFGAVP